MVIIALEENPTGTQVKSRLSLNGFIFKFFTWIKAFTKIGSAFWCFKFFTWIKAFTKIGCAFWCLVLLGLVVLKNILTGPLFQKPELDTKQIVLIAAHIAFYSTIVLSPVHIYNLGKQAKLDAFLNINTIEAPHNFGFILALAFLQICKVVLSLIDVDWIKCIQIVVTESTYTIVILYPMMMFGSLVSNFNKERLQ